MGNLDVNKLAERFAKEKEVSEKNHSELLREAARQAEIWIENAPFEAVKKIASLPRREFDYRGHPRDGAWTNEYFEQLINIGRESSHYKINIAGEEIGTVNAYIDGFVGRVKSVWNDVSGIWRKLEAEIRG